MAKRSLATFIGTTLEQRVEELLAAFDTAQKARDSYFANPRNLQYQVRIASAWAPEGEKGVTITDRSLKKAMADAVAEFKRVNNRSDVQGTFQVKVLVSPLAAGIDLPQEYWKHLQG